MYQWLVTRPSAEIAIVTLLAGVGCATAAAMVRDIWDQTAVCRFRLRMLARRIGRGVRRVWRELNRTF